MDELWGANLSQIFCLVILLLVIILDYVTEDLLQILQMQGHMKPE